VTIIKHEIIIPDLSTILVMVRDVYPNRYFAGVRIFLSARWYLMEVVARFVRNVLNGGDVGVVLSCVVYGGC